MIKKPINYRFEPFKIKMVEPIQVADPLTESATKRREEVLEQAHYNLFYVPAQDISIDLLTDSGTGSMSQDQWSAMMLADESYAQAISFTRFEKAIQDIISTDFHIIPTHQGRAAENLLFYALNEMAADASSDGRPLRRRVLINSFFDTTAANVMLHGALTEEDIGGVNVTGLSSGARRKIEINLKRELLIGRNQLVVDQSRNDLFEHGMFGGNIDLDRLETILKDDPARAEVLLVMLTTTNNTGGGLPVSMANLRAVRQMVDHYSKNDPVWADGLPPLMLFMDACRYAENAYFIQQHEPGYSDKSVKDIAGEMWSLVDGGTMSAKKDGMANMGGFLACRSGQLKQRVWEHMVEIESFFTYGGLSGHDMEAVAVGMREGVEDARVTQRIMQVQRLWRWLKDEGIPVKEPCGGHGVFVQGRKFWEKDSRPLIAPEDLPAHTFANELFRRYGIRGCEIGTIMFGDYIAETGKPAITSPDDNVRLAIPRRVYTDTHLQYVAASLVDLYSERTKSPWRGMKFSYRPDALPHFLSHFTPIKAS